jgi:hypothetical protein
LYNSARFAQNRAQKRVVYYTFQVNAYPPAHMLIFDKASDALQSNKTEQNFDYQIIKLHFQGCLRGNFLGKNPNEKQL